ncbi:uncharacterized protein LOC117706606 isoform X2 [Arvicanthis niloticus]|uniref:uncharacterized protein LOC117706606 isoform X2 n=1 Tax=Arvicanthis niloticus TaxID=61156 RepID=UPI00402B5207
MLRQRYWSRILHSTRREKLGENSGQRRRRVASPSGTEARSSHPPRSSLLVRLVRMSSLALGFSPGRVGAPPSRPLSEDVMTGGIQHHGQLPSAGSLNV